MSAIAPVLPLSRPVRTALVALLAAMVLTAAPRTVRPDSGGSAPAKTADNAETARLLHLVARLNLNPPAAPVPDGHAVRRPVRPYAVRLAADPLATHPLDHRLGVRVTHLGAPARQLRRIALPLPTPEPGQPLPQAQAAPPARTALLAPKVEPALLARNPAAAPASPARAVKIPPQPGSPSAGPGRSVLVAGDSLSIFLAQALRPLLAGRPGTAFIARGKVSSGLARPDFFDWEREMRQLSVTHRPDTVLVMIATNDNQTMTRPDGKKVAFGRSGWDAEYARRVRRLVELARAGNPHARVYWVGAPVMASPRLNADVAAINDVIRRQVASLPGCRFVNVWRTLADASGRYAPALPAPGGRRTRTPDGVHLTPYGARLLANACLTSLGTTVASLDRP